MEKAVERPDSPIEMVAFVAEAWRAKIQPEIPLAEQFTVPISQRHDRSEIVLYSILDRTEQAIAFAEFLVNPRRLGPLQREEDAGGRLVRGGRIGLTPLSRL